MRRCPGCATYTPTQGVRHHLLAACELGEDRLYGHVKPYETRTPLLEFCRYPRTLHPPTARIAIIRDKLQPAPNHRQDARVGASAAAKNTETAYTPTNSSWLTGARPSSRPCGTSPSKGPTPDCTTALNSPLDSNEQDTRIHDH